MKKNIINSVSQKSVRSSNLELYRILVMLSIVFHHYVVNSGLSAYMDAAPTAPRSIFLYIIGMWGKTGINCFVLITGYFMCQKSITMRKFLKLLLEVEFYNVTIYLIFIATGYQAVSFRELLFTLLPVKGIGSNFTSAYLIFFLFIPFLNMIVNNCTKKQHLSLVLLCLFVYTLLNILPGLEVRMNYVSWFCVLFFIGSYLRLHPIYKSNDTLFWFRLFVASILIAIASVIILIWARQHGFPYGPYTFVSDSNAPLAVLVSVCAFMFFKNVKIKQSNFVNILGGGGHLECC